MVAGCGVELEHNLDERQANQVVALLEQSGVSADKEREQGGAFTVVVPRGDAARAFALLESHDLPRRGQKGLAETFGGGGLLPSAVEERARLSAALASELERTLEAVSNVRSARVHLALPESQGLFGDGAHARPTASVLLKAAGALPFAEAEVRRIVAGAVHGLQSADVSVVIAPLPTDVTQPPLDRIGPVRVAHESRTTVAAFATGGLALILILALAVVSVSLRLSAAKRKLRDLEKS